MLGFVQNWFSARANPIGVDFGADCLRMAQVRSDGGDPQLVAAASCDVPGHVRDDANARLEWFPRAARDLLQQGKFQGRQAVLSLPAFWTHVQHLRMAKMDDETIAKALPWELKGKLPIDPSTALLRHLIAGDLASDQTPQSEVIVMAASRALIEQYLASAAKARLDVVGMNVQPRTVVDCFQHVYRRKSDMEATNFFVDIGHGGTRAVIARGGRIYFARMIPIGGERFNQLVAEQLNIPAEEARLLRLQSASAEEPAEPADASRAAPESGDNSRSDDSFALLEAGLKQSRTLTEAAMPDTSHESRRRRVDLAVADAVNRLAEELDLCRRYYEATFAQRPVDRLIFVGGEANQRELCRRIARHLSLAAQVGDPLARMGRTSQVGVESGIDRRQPQPAWTVAVGLSLNQAALIANGG